MTPFPSPALLAYADLTFPSELAKAGHRMVWVGALLADRNPGAAADWADAAVLALKRAHQILVTATVPTEALEFHRMADRAIRTQIKGVSGLSQALRKNDAAGLESGAVAYGAGVAQYSDAVKRYPAPPHGDFDGS